MQAHRYLLECGGVIEVVGPGECEGIRQELNPAQQRHARVVVGLESVGQQLPVARVVVHAVWSWGRKIRLNYNKVKVLIQLFTIFDQFIV